MENSIFSSGKRQALIRRKAQEFLASPKHANNLVEILNLWDEATVPCILNLENVFTEVLKRRDMYLEQKFSLSDPGRSPEKIYAEWLRDCYKQFWEKLYSALENPRLPIQLQALTTALKMMAEEGKSPLEQDGSFPINRLEGIIMKILSSEKDNQQLIARFQEIYNYPDALMFTWTRLPKFISKGSPKQLYIKNVLEFTHKMAPPKDDKGDESFANQELLCGPTLDFQWDYQKVRRRLNKVWSCIKHWELTPQLHKQLLVVLLERIMIHLDKPILWTDFLMDSLDKDGPIGMLALQGVFTLVTKYNLEYPNIFTKLYSMFEPEIFHTKYKARLFYLCDLFLSSSHLPEALVAAFAKRLSRLTLVAPPEDISIILLLVGNLILRHPGLKRLIDHQENGVNLGAGDPFLMEERDPLLSNALQSSLWEIKTQQCHILPSIAKEARFIQEPLPSVEYDMASALECTGGHIFDRELKKRVKEIMLTFERPNSMALAKGERMVHYWHLTTTHRAYESHITTPFRKISIVEP